MVTIDLEKSTDLLEWMISPTQTKSGKVIFNRHDGMGSLLTIEFRDAYCGRLGGQYNSVSSKQVRIKLKISAQSILFNGVTHTNNWPTKSA